MNTQIEESLKSYIQTLPLTERLKVGATITTCNCFVCEIIRRVMAVTPGPWEVR